MVDTCYVGRLGALSLAAIGPSSAAFGFVFSTASSVLMVPTAVMISKARAKSNTVGVGRTLTFASALAAVLGIFLSWFFYVHCSVLLSVLGAPTQALHLAIPYLRWRALSMPANLLLLVAAGACRGMKEPKVSLVNGFLIGGINMVLDPLLMFGLNLGTAGAAMATAAAQWATLERAVMQVGLLAYIRYFWKRREELGLGNPTSLPTKKEMQEFIGASGTMFFRQLCNVGAWTLMASIASRMGVLEIAAHQLILSMWLVIAFVQDSLGVAGQVLVSQYLGMSRDASGTPNQKGEQSEAIIFQETARSVAKRVLTLSLGVGIVLASCSSVVVPLMLPLICHSAEVVKIVSQVFLMIMFAFPMCCLVWSWDALFYGASDFVYNAKTVAVASALGVAGTLCSLSRGWGVRGLWVSMTFVLFGVRLLAHTWRFNSPHGPFGAGQITGEDKLGFGVQGQAPEPILGNVDSGGEFCMAAAA
ncbi:unnamed protein product [Choristocarpus tenellus]